MMIYGAKTNNQKFDDENYLVIRNLWNPAELQCYPPDETGIFRYDDRGNLTEKEEECQVVGSTSRYFYPGYKHIHIGIRRKIEEVIGKKLYDTYYYDRFYFPGQALTRHAYRDACEISVTVHISTNLEGKDADWPIWIKTPDTYTDETKSKVSVPGENKSVILKAGDGMIYKGCERPHWRDPMPTPRRRKRDIILRRKQKEYYYHQIFFHYVLADGQRAHCANDSTR